MDYYLVRNVNSHQQTFQLVLAVTQVPPPVLELREYNVMKDQSHWIVGSCSGTHNCSAQMGPSALPAALSQLHCTDLVDLSLGQHQLT